MRLKDDGWRVFATARTDPDLAELEAEGLEPLKLDYAETASIRSAVDEMLARTDGRLDALFNNGAYAQPGAVEDLETDVLRAQFEANFFGWHEMTRLVVPLMRGQDDLPGRGGNRGQINWGRGRIVHCSSILGFVPYRWRGAYNASKHALEALFLTQRMELKGSGIHMSLIEPGPIVSSFSQKAIRYFLDNVDIEASVHAALYKDYLARLREDGGVNRFRLGPEAVYAKLDHALNSPRPRAQYPVTLPSRVMAMARGIVPQRLLEHILMRSD